MTVSPAVSVEVMLYRGLQRNKRRGFHNLEAFHGLVVDLRCEAVPENETTRPHAPSI